MAVLKLSSEENIIPDEALGPDAWNERSWEKDSRDKTWKSWATWNLILSSKSKSHLTSFIDESNHDMFVSILGRNSRPKYESLLSLEIKKMTQHRDAFLSLGSTSTIEIKENRKKTLLFISMSSNKTEILAYVSFSWSLSCERSFAESQRTFLQWLSSICKSICRSNFSPW